MKYLIPMLVVFFLAVSNHAHAGPLDGISVVGSPDMSLYNSMAQQNQAVQNVTVYQNQMGTQVYDSQGGSYADYGQGLSGADVYGNTVVAPQVIQPMQGLGY